MMLPDGAKPMPLPNLPVLATTRADAGRFRRADDHGRGGRQWDVTTGPRHSCRRVARSAQFFVRGDGGFPWGSTLTRQEEDRSFVQSRWKTSSMLVHQSPGLRSARGTCIGSVTLHHSRMRGEFASFSMAAANTASGPGCSKYPKSCPSL